MINRRRRSARSRLQFQIQTSFTLAAVKDCIGRTFRSAMESTNRSMPARRGGLWDCATVSRSRNWLLIQKMPTGFSWPWPAIRTGLTKSAVCSDHSMAVKHLRRSFTAMKTLARATCRSIQATQRLFTQRCGNRVKVHGKTAFSMEIKAAFSNRSMAAKRGGS